MFNFNPPATNDEIRDASLQFVRKISGFRTPSKTNEMPFMMAVNEIAQISTVLLRNLGTSAAPRTREQEMAKVRARSAKRFPGHVSV